MASEAVTLISQGRPVRRCGEDSGRGSGPGGGAGGAASLGQPLSVLARMVAALLLAMPVDRGLEAESLGFIDKRQAFFQHHGVTYLGMGSSWRGPPRWGLTQGYIS